MLQRGSCLSEPARVSPSEGQAEECSVVEACRGVFEATRLTTMSAYMVAATILPAGARPFIGRLAAALPDPAWSKMLQVRGACMLAHRLGALLVAGWGCTPADVILRGLA